MSGDFSRRTYKPRMDFVGVFEQQGRVRVDADLNELVEVVDRRFRTTSMDVLHASAGRVVVPTETPDAFAIAITGGSLSIGPGRAYVDGIQADNHGVGVPPPALHFDRGIEEKVGADPLPFTPQPYLPTQLNAPRDGIHLAYLDVWHRERTKDEVPEILDPALYGIDTATRRQIVWQVKLLKVSRDVHCDTPVDQITGWPAASAARLTTAAVGVPAVDDPCEIPPVGGYRGVTNRLYRVEIHDGGPVGQATFKWSAGPIGTSILAINGTEITVARLGKDKYARFATGDWVEVLDDIRELEGRPGEMAKIASVDEARGIVTLTAPLAGPFPAPATNRARLRKWDQRVGVPSSGVFTVGSTPFVLEDGVQIQFSLDQEINGGVFMSHEFWLFAARAADSSVEELDAAPPVGPLHHFGKLAVIDMPAGTVVDCRHLWPPAGDGGDLERDLTRIVMLSWTHNGTLELFRRPVIDTTGARRMGLVVAFSREVDVSLIDAEHVFTVDARNPFAGDEARRLGLRCRCPLHGEVVPVKIQTVNNGLIEEAVEVPAAQPPQPQFSEAIAFVFDENVDALAHAILGIERKASFGVHIRGDFVIDRDGRAVDAEFVRAELPTGDRPKGSIFGIQGGTFDSWCEALPG
jgi:hypothetical protein